MNFVNKSFQMAMCSREKKLIFNLWLYLIDELTSFTSSLQSLFAAFAFFSSFVYRHILAEKIVLLFRKALREYRHIAVQLSSSSRTNFAKKKKIFCSFPPLTAEFHEMLNFSTFSISE